jgi:hypothetical protein
MVQGQAAMRAKARPGCMEGQAGLACRIATDS